MAYWLIHIYAVYVTACRNHLQKNLTNFYIVNNKILSYRPSFVYG